MKTITLTVNPDQYLMLINFLKTAQSGELNKTAQSHTVDLFELLKEVISQLLEDISKTELIIKLDNTADIKITLTQAKALIAAQYFVHFGSDADSQVSRLFIYETCKNIKTALKPTANAK